ncbi:MAG: hydantoinase B/oxoprolinase family protein, partial [Akkermansiaceae bacterium]|nr:hydantoinase B/oxoprolinase family protein [Akkermansiaceae bacterium]
MLDPITSLVIKDSLEAISEEMSKTVERTAVHPLFNEVHDYSTGVFFYDGDDV